LNGSVNCASNDLPDSDTSHPSGAGCIQIFPLQPEKLMLALFHVLLVECHLLTAMMGIDLVS